MISADKKQKQIIAILTKGDKELKAQLVVQETQDEAKCSTNNLTFVQANNIIRALGGNVVVNKWTRFDKNKTSHMKVLNCLYDLGWTFFSQDKGRSMANMASLGAWLQTKAPVKKPLIDMTATEVSKTIHALESMLRKSIKKTPQSFN